MHACACLRMLAMRMLVHVALPPPLPRCAVHRRRRRTPLVTVICQAFAKLLRNTTQPKHHHAAQHNTTKPNATNTHQTHTYATTPRDTNATQHDANTTQHHASSSVNAVNFVHNLQGASLGSLEPKTNQATTLTQVEPSPKANCNCTVCVSSS